MKAPEKNYAIIQRGTNAPELRWTTDETPEGFAGFLYDVPKLYLQDGDVVSICGYAKFAKEREWRLPSIELIGINQPEGPLTELFTCCPIDAVGGKKVGNTPSIVLAQKNIFRNLRLTGRCAITDEDAAITGHDKLGDNYTLFDACELDAAMDQDWGSYYQWNTNKDQNGYVGYLHCTGWFSRFFCSRGASASPKASTYLFSTKLYGDGNGSFTNGATNMLKDQASVCPLLQRSGRAYFENVETWVKGLSSSQTPGFGIERVVGLASNVYSSNAGPLAVTGKNVRVHLGDKGMAKEAFDIDARYGSPLPVIDNTSAIAAAEAENAKRLADARGGSGEGGEFKVWKP
jgi:hypothetical protein